MKQLAYKHGLLAVLLIILAFNYIDRLALGLVLQHIKADLILSDTQLGLLSGIAFALFYSIMGIPIARWADRGNRVTIISGTIALWTVAVALCAVARSFTQLLLIRVGVAVGEAGCIPPAHSLIADYFDRAERPRAVAIYMLGGPLSMLVGYFTASWLNELYGWRVMFMLLSLPGVGLTALAWLVLREPRRNIQISRSRTHPMHIPPARVDLAPIPQVDTLQVSRILWRNRTFRHLLLCVSVVYFFGYGLLQWQPTFFIRSYHLTGLQLGAWFAVLYGLGGLVGTYLGGEWASRRAGTNERLQLLAMSVGYACFGFLSVGLYLSSNRTVAFALLAAAIIGQNMVTGPLFATLQTLVPPRMRATSVALVYLFANLIGMGFGPLAAGALSDALRLFAGEQSLRYALLILSPGYLWGAWHLWRASQTVACDLQRGELESTEPAHTIYAVTHVPQ